MLSSVQTDPTPSVSDQYLLARALLSGLLGAFATVLLLIGYLGGEHYKKHLWINFLPDKIQVVQGTSETKPDAIIIQSLTEQNVALLSSPRGFAFQTDQLNRFHWCLSGANRQLKLRLLWTISATPGQVHTAVLDAQNGCHAFNIDQFENWFGLADGLGLQLEGEASEPLIFTEISLRPIAPSAVGLLHELWRDWSTYQGWHASSVNFVHLGALPALAPVAFAVFTWAVISAVLFFVLLRARSNLPAGLFIFAIVAWFALDMLWQWELGQRTLSSYRMLAGKSLSERLRQYDGDIISTLEDIRAELPSTPQRIFILGDETKRTQKARLHYHLLPHNVYSYGINPPTSDIARPGDYLLVLGHIENVRYRNRRSHEALFWGAKNQYQLAVKPLLADQIGVLFLVRDP